MFVGVKSVSCHLFGLFACLLEKRVPDKSKGEKDY